MVDGLCKTELVDTGLQTTLKEVLDTEGQDVIELHTGLIEHTNADQTTNQSVTFEKTLGVLLVEGEKLTRPKCISHCSQLSQANKAHTEQHDGSWTE